MIEHRWRLLCTLQQAAQQNHHPLLQPHPMGEAVFLVLELLTLLRILQLGRLQVGQQLLLGSALLL